MKEAVAMDGVCCWRIGIEGREQDHGNLATFPTIPRRKSSLEDLVALRNGRRINQSTIHSPSTMTMNADGLPPPSLRVVRPMAV